MPQHLRIQCTKFFIKKRNNCRKTEMLWHGIPNGCGLLPPEDEKTNMWHGREKWCGLRPSVFPRSLYSQENS